MRDDKESPMVEDNTHESYRDSNTGSESRLLEQHFEKLMVEHGLTKPTIIDAGLYTATPKVLNKLLKRGDITSSGIVIPYSVDFCRARLDIPLKYENGRTAKYLSPSGSQNRLYIPKAVRLILTDSSVSLYITEGEFKALKLTQEGFPCIGLAGIWCYSRDKGLLPDFDNVELKNRKVFIILDSDAREKTYDGE